MWLAPLLLLGPAPKKKTANSPAGCVLQLVGMTSLLFAGYLGVGYRGATFSGCPGAPSNLRSAPP